MAEWGGVKPTSVNPNLHEPIVRSVYSARYRRTDQGPNRYYGKHHSLVDPVETSDSVR